MFQTTLDKKACKGRWAAVMSVMNWADRGIDTPDCGDYGEAQNPTVGLKNRRRSKKPEKTSFCERCRRPVPERIVRSSRRGSWRGLG